MTDNLVYEKNILIRSEQVDMTRKLRISELFRIMEEASIAHTEELGCTRHKTLDRGLLWVIARQEADIIDLPAYDEEIVIKSWQGNMMQMFFPRFYEIYRGDELLVRGYAFWTLIDEETRDMIMPEEYDIYIPSKPDSEDVYLKAVVIPKDAEPVRSTELKVRFSQVDINGHMNNTRYFDIIDDAIWADKADGNCTETSVPHSILANYINELRMGETFTLNEYEADGSMIFEGISDENKFKVKITY